MMAGSTTNKRTATFAKKPQLKIARHLRTAHKGEEEAENYINETDFAKKNLQLLKLRNMGNHEHNLNVVKKNQVDSLFSTDQQRTMLTTDITFPANIALRT